MVICLISSSRKGGMLVVTFIISYSREESTVVVICMISSSREEGSAVVTCIISYNIRRASGGHSNILQEGGRQGGNHLFQQGGNSWWSTV